MRNSKVYDLPLRLFHWIFAGLFVGAFIIAKSIDDDSSVYAYHMLMGIIMAKLVLLRIIWGLFGTKFARFSNFKLSPGDLVIYFKQLLTSKNKRYLGHNPASSWVAVIMLGLAVGLAISGMLMVRGINDEFFEEVHELFAHAFLFISVAHIAGVLLHSFKYQDGLALSMLDGKKEPVNGTNGIESNRPVVAIIMMVLLGVIVFNLNRNYDASKGSLIVAGTTFQLTEDEDD